jgi:hypothetical protein
MLVVGFPCIHILYKPVASMATGSSQFAFFYFIDEALKKKRGIRRATRGLGMELGGEDGLAPVPDALASLIVQVDKIRQVVAGKPVVVDGITVVLGCDEAPVAFVFHNRLVVAAVSVLELIGCRTAGYTQ